MNLLEKIESRQAVVGVVGMGYVGLPLAVAFAEAGFRVIGIDINEERMAAINRGESYISDIPSAQVAALTAPAPAMGPLAHSGRDSGSPRRLATAQPSTLQSANRLSGTTDYDALCDADAVIICVPTPLAKNKDPDMSHIITATDEIGRRLDHEMLIVLESTTYPGTTEELVLPRLEAGTKGRGAETNGHEILLQSLIESEATPAFSQQNSSIVPAVDGRRHVVGKDFFLAFSPERIDPGRTDFTIHNTPKIISGVTPRCTEIAHALYACIIEQVVPVSAPKVAEMVKLLENTFRAVNIALVNEVAIICDRLGIDVWEVIDAAETKPFGFMPFYPGPGLGGHCIPIDPQYLAWKLKTLNYNARFIQLAAEINFDMPPYVLSKIADALNDCSKALKGSRVLILGVAYKAGVGDLRESPALDLIHLLQQKGTNVTYHDPYVPRLNMNGREMTSVSLDRDTLQTTDCVVITTAHDWYDWEWVVESSRLVIDTRNATKGVTANQARIVKL